MEHFCGEKNRYLKYLEQKKQGKEPDMKSWEIYVDPDNTYNDSDSEFYNGLTAFLMARRDAGDTWSYTLHGYINGNEQPAGIWAEDGVSSEPVLYLRSDQLGFSAPKKEGSWDERYPYASFLNSGGEERFVADCVWDTRTLGGSFLWPLIRSGRNWQSWYNSNRGVKTYIEDSVDLTLYEIRRFYELLEAQPGVDDETICEKLMSEGCLLLNSTDKLVICKWLRHFGSFKNYVEYFCFRPFVNDLYQIVDITKAKLAWNDEEEYGFAPVSDDSVLSRESVEGYRGAGRIKGTKDVEKLRQILVNVRAMTVKRTKKMEEVVDQYRKHI